MPDILVVTACGDYYAVGRAIGRAVADRLRPVLDHYRGRWRDLGISDEAALDVARPYFAATEAAFPKLVAELAGMADGADVPVLELFRAECHEARVPVEWEAMRREFVSRLPSEESTVPGPAPVGEPATTPVAPAALEPVPAAPSGCTSVVSRRRANGKSRVVVGHTEDSWPQFFDTMYVLRALVMEGDTSTAICALNYTHSLVGSAAAINGHGLVHLVDNLPRTPLQEGVPKHVVSRAILDQPSIEDAVDLLRRTRRASGWNHLFVQGDRVVNVETTAARVAVEEVRAPVYVHTNHYLNPGLATLAGPPRSDSLARLARAQALVRPGMGVRQMQHLLADREGFPESICREPTLGAFVCDSRRRAVWIVWGQPGTPGTIWRRYHPPDSVS